MRHTHIGISIHIIKCLAKEAIAKFSGDVKNVLMTLYIGQT